MSGADFKTEIVTLSENRMISIWAAILIILVMSVCVAGFAICLVCFLIGERTKIWRISVKLKIHNQVNL